MRSIIVFFVLSAAAIFPAHARDTKYKLPIQDVMDMVEYKDKIGIDVKFFLGDQKETAIEQKFGEYTTNKKTNAFNKTDEEACRWVMLSALITLKEKAIELGGNAVINIKSYYKKEEFSSETKYECHAGALMSGVALKGSIARLK